MSVLTKKTISKINAILGLEAHGAAPITTWNDVRDVLIAEGICYKQKIHTRNMLIHSSNRGTLGVNAHQAHRNGQTILKIGGDLDKLSNSCCFELPQDLDDRQRLIDFNHANVERANKMLARVNGTERHASVGGGHTSQFCKAVDACCETPLLDLANADGCLSKEKISKDRILGLMIEEGWEWLVIPSCVEAEWPRMPDLAQRALNASNNAVTESSELETGVTIAEFALAEFSSRVDYSLCVAAAAASMPPCREYVGIIGEYVRQFGGGEGAPIIKFLDQFASRFGGNRKIGEEMFTALNDTKFPLETSKFVFTRNGCLAALLVGNKVVDGLAKSLNKSDLDKLKSPKKLAELIAHEQALSDAWDTLHSLVADALITPADMHALFGRLLARATFVLINNQKYNSRATCTKISMMSKMLFQQSFSLYFQRAPFHHATWLPTAQALQRWRQQLQRLSQFRSATPQIHACCWHR